MPAGRRGCFEQRQGNLDRRALLPIVRAGPCRLGDLASFAHCVPPLSGARRRPWGAGLSPSQAAPSTAALEARIAADEVPLAPARLGTIARPIARLLVGLARFCFTCLSLGRYRSRSDSPCAIWPFRRAFCPSRDAYRVWPLFLHVRCAPATECAWQLCVPQASVLSLHSAARCGAEELGRTSDRPTGAGGTS